MDDFFTIPTIGLLRPMNPKTKKMINPLNRSIMLRYIITSEKKKQIIYSEIKPINFLENIRCLTFIKCMWRESKLHNRAMTIIKWSVKRMVISYKPYSDNNS